MTTGHVTELWRFPVKSLGGGTVDQADIGPRGVLGDRLWAVRDLEKDITASARRVPALLGATARYAGPVPADAGPGNAPEVIITFPDGTEMSSSDEAVNSRLSELAGREVRLTALPPADDTSLHRMNLDRQKDAVSPASVRADFGVADGEAPPDFALFPMADLLKLGRYSTPPGMFVDLAPIHVMTTASLATIGAELGGNLDVRRFRPNVLVALDDADDGLPETQWTGARATVGDVQLKVISQTVRCVVPSRAQPGLEVDRRVTRAVAAHAQRCLGVYCTVGRAGSVRVGDRITVEPVVATRGRKVLQDMTMRAKRATLGLTAAAADRFTR